MKLPHFQTSESWCKAKQDAGHSRPLQVSEFVLHHISQFFILSLLVLFQKGRILDHSDFRHTRALLDFLKAINWTHLKLNLRIIRIDANICARSDFVQIIWHPMSIFRKCRSQSPLNQCWWKTEVVPQPFRIRYRSALWLRSNFLNPSEFPPCILTCSKKFLPWGWAICWAISWDVRGIWSIAPTKCRSLSERPPDLSVPQCVTNAH